MHVMEHMANIQDELSLFSLIYRCFWKNLYSETVICIQMYGELKFSFSMKSCKIRWRIEYASIDRFFKQDIDVRFSHRFIEVKTRLFT